jgi:hypothetical protein
MRVRLTDRFCASAKAERQVDYFDEKVPGLSLRVPMSRCASQASLISRHAQWRSIPTKRAGCRPL